ncbi:hypothetical protein UPYG_G00273000 [Umbra pygmaea]|uniref:B30.2/SPRY domain-containing protein n=1 Tax=Umbra pygmaea TaxID=75934 RepID=A0ABD0WVI0_UMBPY
MDPTYKRKRLNEGHCVEAVARSEQMLYACQLTVDPNTANPNLKLSEGNRKVTWVDEVQAYEDHADRFDHVPQVLCREALSGSRFYWEVDWHSGNAVIGVAYHGINRKSEGCDSRLGSNNMSWSLYCSDNGYYFYDAGIPQRSIAGVVFRRVGVYLDWLVLCLSSAFPLGI